MPNAHQDMLIEQMLLVLFNVIQDIFLADQFVNYLFKLAHLDNSIMLKTVFVLLAHIRAHNVNTLLLIALHAHLDLLLPQINAVKQTVVEQENTELHQDHVQLVQQNVSTVSVPHNVPLALQAMFSMELTVL